MTQAVVDGVRARRRVDLAGRRIEAAALADVIHAHDPQVPGRLTLANAAVIGDRLDLSGVRFAGPLTFEDCCLGALDLSRAEVGLVRLVATGPGRVMRATSVDLTGATTKGVHLERAHLSAVLDLSYARVDGSVAISHGSRIDGHGHVALRAEGLRLDGDLIVESGPSGDRTRLGGAIRVTGADIRGGIQVSDAEVGAGEATGSIQADFVRARESVLVERSHLDGPLRMASAHIGGQVVVHDATHVGQRDGVSLSMAATTVERAVLVGGWVLPQGPTPTDPTPSPHAPTPTAPPPADPPPTPPPPADSPPAPVAPGAAPVARDRATVLDGAIHAPGASLGDLWLRPPAKVAANRWRNAVFIERAKVEGDVRIGRPTITTARDGVVRLTGAVTLTDAEVGGSIVVRDGARLRPRGPLDGRRSIDAPGARVTRDVSLEARARLGGTVDLSGATVGGDVVVAGSDGDERLALRRGAPAHRLRLNGAAMGALRFRVDPGFATVDLRGCRVGELDDHPEAWRMVAPGADGPWAAAGDPHVLLGDLQVGRLPSDDDFAKADRHRWLAHALSPHDGAKVAAGPSTYRSFAKALTAAGDDDAALDLLGAMKREHRPWYVRVLLSPVGQGYRPLRAIVFLAALVVATWAFVDVAADRDVLVAADGRTTCTEARCVSPFYVAVDTVVPVLDLGARADWEVAPRRGAWYWTAHVVLMLARGVGAALTTLFLIGATGRVLDRRDGL